MGIVQVMLGVPTICIVRVTTPQVQWNFDLIINLFTYMNFYETYMIGQSINPTRKRHTD